MYTPAVFAKRVGVSVKTLQKWDRTLVLPAKRTITNRRYYTDEYLAAALRLPRVQKHRRSVAYCRVSSQAQKPDVLKQQTVLHAYREQQEIVVDERITEIGGSLNFERKQFLKLVDAMVTGEIACGILAIRIAKLASNTSCSHTYAKHNSASSW